MGWLRCKSINLQIIPVNNNRVSVAGIIAYCATDMSVKVPIDTEVVLYTIIV